LGEKGGVGKLWHEIIIQDSKDFLKMEIFDVLEIDILIF